jgi:hypothetical protein
MRLGDRNYPGIQQVVDKRGTHGAYVGTDDVHPEPVARPRDGNLAPARKVRYHPWTKVAGRVPFASKMTFHGNTKTKHAMHRLEASEISISANRTARHGTSPLTSSLSQRRVETEQNCDGQANVDGHSILVAH